jgi:hypothetical protein
MLRSRRGTEFDPELVDGVQCAIYFDALKRYLADPESLGG